MTTANLLDLPAAEKLKLIEILWDSLCAQPADAPVSPAWHRAVLDMRSSRLASGEEGSAPWPEAKARIRAQVQSG